MSFRIKIAIAALLLSLTVLASWTNSDALYGFYLRTWHKTVRGESSFTALAEAQRKRELFRKEQEKISGSAARKEHEEEFAGSFSRDLTRSLLIYAPLSAPSDALSEDDKELCRYAGSWFIEQGDTIRGCGLILRTVGREVARDEIVPFTQALDVMFREKMYSDIVAEVSSRVFSSDDERYPLRVGVYLRYGISLYHQKRFKEALSQLRSAESAGEGESDLYYYIAETFRSMNQTAEAVPYAEKALSLSPKDRRYRALLVAVYNAEGRRKDAERASRSY